MNVRSISVRRVNDFGNYGKVDWSQPFQATVGVESQNSKVELILSAEMSRRIVELLAEEIAAAGRATAEAMTAEIFNVVALAAPKGAEAADDDMPF